MSSLEFDINNDIEEIQFRDDQISPINSQESSDLFLIYDQK